MKKTYEEMEISNKGVAQIALHAYSKWKEAMKPPLFAVIPFEEWLQKIIDED